MSAWQNLRLIVALATSIAAAALVTAASGQQVSPLAPDIEMRGPLQDALPPGAVPEVGNTTVIPRQSAHEPRGDGLALVQFEALLTDDGERIDDGVIWRLYSATPDQGGKPLLIGKHTSSAPALRLKPGNYLVHASYGQAHATRRITIPDGGERSERLVLNAGGLRLSAIITSATPAPDTAVQYDVFSEERDQSDNPVRVVSGARPGVVVRLNSGLYRIVSRYGAANAVVQTNVTVEPGKLTDLSISHAAAMVTFKLVTRSGGEAMAATQWSIQAPNGTEVVKSTGALPTHILAPGPYTVIAQTDGRTFRRDFSVDNGETVSVELLFR